MKKQLYGTINYYSLLDKKNKNKKLTGKNYPYTHYMTLREWKWFKKEYYACDWNRHTPIGSYLKQFAMKSFYSLVTNAFQWSETVYGRKYWDDISNRISPLKRK